MRVNSFLSSPNEVSSSVFPRGNFLKTNPWVCRMDPRRLFGANVTMSNDPEVK